jgi:hypothetical protein
VAFTPVAVPTFTMYAASTLDDSRADADDRFGDQPIGVIDFGGHVRFGRTP